MRPTKAQKLVSLLFGIFLFFAGFSHLTFQRKAFLAQVPDWVPINADLVVILSGIIELILGLSLIFLPKQQQKLGWIIAVFLLLVFPGNIAQLINKRHAFGLNSDLLLWLRLPLQPILIATVLWSTGAWRQWRNK
jgi:uncharacterized membrane protein